MSIESRLYLINNLLEKAKPFIFIRYFFCIKTISKHDCLVTSVSITFFFFTHFWLIYGWLNLSQIRYITFCKKYLSLKKLAIYFFTFIFFINLTSPGKKQMCLRSICLPNVICRSVRCMCRVSTMSHSRARGWLRRALSRRGIWALMCWNLISILFCSWWKVELRRPAAISFNLRHT